MFGKKLSQPGSTPDKPGHPVPRRGVSVAIIGAGLSGLCCAEKLQNAGHSVRVFDKGRGVGGRMSTRRANGWRFDHGAQYFTVREPRFASAVESWLRADVVARWDGKIVGLDKSQILPGKGETDRYVGVPGMNAICRHLAAGLELSTGTRVGKIELDDDRWLLTSDDGAALGRFEWVVVSAPPPQTAQLLELPAPGMAKQAAQAQMAPCWAAMVAFDSPLGLAFDGAFVDGSPLSWIARNGSKPGRPDGEAWILHGSPDWSREHLELERADVTETLLGALAKAVGQRLPEPVHVDAMLWRFALPTEPLAAPYLMDADLRLAACGDWCGGPRVEGAFLSGNAVADSLMALCPS